ncbi:crossover junction endodeoxyribonuclease RuvC [Campylobacter sp. MOP7]|uniref:crossover junction endodeoxyribonuclease RuvC n=1 Tax=Campylobacter canis TaxID=3378588 RepID=UPI00387E4DED
MKTTAYNRNYDARIFMGIDQSLTHTGVCIISHTPTSTDILYAKGIKVSSDESVERRIYGIVSVIKNTILEFGVDFVGLEGLAYNMSGTNNARILGGLFFCILNALISLNVPYDIYAPKSIKKFATGNGGAKKNEVVDALDTEDAKTLSDISRIKISSQKFQDIADSFWVCKQLIATKGV